jgi:hypothetical protein
MPPTEVAARLLADILTSLSALSEPERMWVIRSLKTAQFAAAHEAQKSADAEAQMSQNAADAEAQKGAHKTQNAAFAAREGEGGSVLSFETFWLLWLKKRDRIDALQVWKNLKPSQILIEQILSAVKTWNETEEWQKENHQFVPSAAKWLRRRKWLDEAPARRGASQAQRLWDEAQEEKRVKAQGGAP